MKNYFAIIDESGRLYDPEDRFLVFAAVVSETLVNLDKIIPQVKKKLPKKTKLAEIKFSTTGDKTRIRVFEKIEERRLATFVLVVDKEGRKITDTPENYSLLVASLLKKVLRKYPTISHIIIDRHFTWVTQREKFNDLLQEKLGKALFIEHLDSQQNTIVSLADFVAGAFRVKYAKNISQFADKIEKRVEGKVITSWRALKQKGKSLKESRKTGVLLLPKVNISLLCHHCQQFVQTSIRKPKEDGTGAVNLKQLELVNGVTGAIELRI